MRAHSILAAPRLGPDSRDASPRLLQRKCACGRGAGVDGACADCRASQLQRSPAAPHRGVATPSILDEVLRSKGEPLAPALRHFMAARFAGVMAPQPAGGAAPQLAAAQLTRSRPSDRSEQQAETVAARVMGVAPMSSAATIEPVEDAFARIRVHRDARAEQSARAIGAHAYTVGTDIVFGPGAYVPHTEAGQRLLAHELAHTLQQPSSPAAMVMGAWDKAASECADAAAPDRWIEKVVVNQEQPQTVRAFWSDGAVQSDACSSGKGHCCVDPAAPSGVACTVSGSHADGSNCTPITQHMGYPVKNRVLDHSGVAFWTEFVPERAIALHEYEPVDGTPLSHGCVRMNHDMAKTIFCNVRQNQTWVQVHGFARPSCDHAALQQEWLGDFAVGGADLSKADGDTASQIRETRRELNAAFGRTLTVDEIRALTVDDIPRCSATAPLPKPAAP